MERSLLDSDVFSEALRARNPSIRAKADAYLDVFGRFTLSVITVSELIDGLRREQRNDRITALIAEIAAVNHEEAAKIAGHIFGDLHRMGKPIGRSDPFIAAIALREGIPLVTGNVGHFERI